MGILMESSEGNSVGGNRRIGEPELFSAMSAPGEYYETLHTIAINTRETEFGSYVEPIPITLKAYKHMQTLPRAADGYGFQSVITPLNPVSQGELDHPMPSVIIQSPVKEDRAKVARPPKKKWIKEYLEEEPKSPVSVRVSEVSVARSNGVVRPPSPPAPAAPPALAPAPAPALPALALAPDPPPAAPPAPILDFAQEHSRPRTNSSHGPSQIPSPPSLSSGSTSSSGSGAGGRAGTREVHNKLEKNRRAHLKECFELLKRQLPAAPDDKKTSNLSILGSAIRYIQVLRRKERECEHEMERLAREKIAAQQRLAALKREVAVRAARRPRAADAAPEEKEREDVINGQVLGLPLKSSGSPPPAPRTPHSPHSPLAPHTAAGHTPLGAASHGTAQLGTAPLSTAPHTLNLSTKLRPLPVLASTASQVVRASYGSRAGALTLTTIAPADSPAQMVGGGLVVGARALQLLSGAPLHVLHHKPNGITTENNRKSKENGIVTTSAVSTEGGSVVVSGLTPLVVSQSTAHLLGTHTLTHKMVETQMVKGSVSPLAVSAQYLSATTIVKPVVVVSGATPPAPPAPPPRDT